MVEFRSVIDQNGVVFEAQLNGHVPSWLATLYDVIWRKITHCCLEVCSNGQILKCKRSKLGSLGGWITTCLRLFQLLVERSQGPAAELQQVYDRIDSWGEVSGHSVWVMTSLLSYKIVWGRSQAQWLSYDKFTIISIGLDLGIWQCLTLKPLGQVYDCIDCWGEVSGHSYRVTTSL